MLCNDDVRYQSLDVVSLARDAHARGSDPSASLTESDRHPSGGPLSPRVRRLTATANGREAVVVVAGWIHRLHVRDTRLLPSVVPTNERASHRLG